MFWGSAWLFENPAACMEEAFFVASWTLKSTATRVEAVSTVDFTKAVQEVNSLVQAQCSNSTMG